MRAAGRGVSVDGAGEPPAQGIRTLEAAAGCASGALSGAGLRVGRDRARSPGRATGADGPVLGAQRIMTRALLAGLLVAILALADAGGPAQAQPRIPDELVLAFLDDAELQERGLRRLDAGSVPLPDGRVVVTDPLVVPGREPFGNVIPPGRYPIRLIESPSLSRVALAVLEVRPGRPTRWKIATLPGQDPSTLAPDEIFGFPVDAGMAAFAASDYGAAIERRTADEMSGDPDFAYFLTSPEHERVFGLPYDEHFADRPIRGERVRAVMFGSGWGDGFYAAY